MKENLAGSLTTILEKMGGRVAEVHDTIEAVQAVGETASLLNADQGAPLIHIAGTAFGHDGAPLRYSEAFYRGDSFEFHTVSKQAAGLTVQVRNSEIGS